MANDRKPSEPGPDGVHAAAETARNEAEQSRRLAENRPAGAGTPARDRGGHGDAAEEARSAAEAARDAALDAVHATADSLKATLEQMRVVEEARRSLRDLRNDTKHN